VKNRGIGLCFYLFSLIHPIQPQENREIKTSNTSFPRNPFPIEQQLLKIKKGCFRKHCCFVISVEVVDLSSRLLAFRGVDGEPPQRFASAGSHLSHSSHRSLAYPFKSTLFSFLSTYLKQQSFRNEPKKTFHPTR